MQLNDRDKGYIFDMLNYAIEIFDLIKDDSHDAFLKDRVKRLAIERLLEIIGEAADHVSVDVQKRSHDIPWSKIIGLRNKISHDYGEILTDRIWLIATESIPDLIRRIESYNFV